MTILLACQAGSALDAGATFAPPTSPSFAVRADFTNSGAGAPTSANFRLSGILAGTLAPALPSTSSSYVVGPADLGFTDRCGDGAVDTGEICDDGNRSAGDCCSPTCTAEPSGDICLDDGESCTSDTCDGTGVCVHLPQSGNCDDGIFCNGLDTCDAGVCSAHAGDPCASGAECASSCDEASQVCTVAAVGVPCSSDDNPCTDDACDGTGICAHAERSGPCDDGVFCNGEDSCSAGTCSVHAGDPCSGTECNACQEDIDSCFVPAAVACTDDGDNCTDDRCDGTGSCAHPPAALSAACYWAVSGGCSKGRNHVRLRDVAEVNGPICGDSARLDRLALVSGGEDIALRQTGATALRVENGVLVDGGDVALGGACAVDIQGIDLLGSGVPRLCSTDVPCARNHAGGGLLDACGRHASMARCRDVPAAVLADTQLLQALPSTQQLGIVNCRRGGDCVGNEYTITLTRQLEVVDFTRLRLSPGCTLRIDAGGSSDRFALVRIDRGGLVLPDGASVVLDGGLTAEHLLFVTAHRGLRTGRSVSGAGTVFSPRGKIALGEGSTWTGAFLAGTGDIDLGTASYLAHVPLDGRPLTAGVAP